jgi:hypothetical protein
MSDARGYTEVPRSAGRFVLTIDLSSGFSDENVVQVKNAEGLQVDEIRVPQIPVCSKDLNLTTGNYTLTVIGHPQWTCRITFQ